MIDLPLQEISISDFRRLEGHRTIPLDAPVVLLHGPNGTGKTSVLSAIEMALTGEIRSMRRHDDRYTAHLPSHGHSFATIRAIVADELLAGDPQRNMTVGGDRIDGRPALSAEAAQFFAERCYLDQVSLGQLLELYQYREGKKESALARFVNVLLGLDQLDALRSGLSETTDVRSMRKLSEGFSLAEANATQSDSRLRLVTGDLEAATADLERARSEMTQAMAALGYQELLRSDSPTLESDVEELLQPNDPSEQLRVIQPVSRQLMALGGRIEGLRTRPSAVRLRDVNATIASTEAAIEQWRITFESPIAIWHEEFAALQLGSPTDLAETLDDELRQIDARAANHADVAAEVELIALRIADQQATLDKVQADIAQAQQEAGSFASALAAVRDHVVSNACPVCDRDFDEVSSGHLVDHVDRKIAELTNVGRRLASLTDQRDSERAGLQADERLLAGMRAQLLSADTLAAAASRRTVVLRLRSRLDELRPAIAEGAALEASLRESQNELEDLQAAEGEERTVRAELSNIATALGEPVPLSNEPIDGTRRRLAEAAAARIDDLEAREIAHETAREVTLRLRRCFLQVDELRDAVTRAAQDKRTWDSRLKEAKRRQSVARAVHTAANDARAAIVRRVFTESLNDVWRSVFTRLAPREPFVPAFGIPTSSKTALEVRLETVHVSGETGGAPQMMLSAGNLNTAALSLFIALHLAVEPLVPCLVFDDPVQSMDEVHIAQFACLIRVLSKNHGRQVIVAVHERELFEYLALELSPAYEGDALITVELGARSDDVDGGITKLQWSPDRAIAV